MRNLNEVAKQCMDELDSIGIQYGNVVEFKVNTRAKSRWGQCKYIGSGKYSININADLLDERTGIDGLKNTIIHELLHSCNGCMAHNATWNSLANKVHRELGYNIKRTSCAEEKCLSQEMIEERNAEFLQRKKSRIKYIVSCENCGVLAKYQRWTKACENPRAYRCARCKGNITVSCVNGYMVLSAA